MNKKKLLGKTILNTRPLSQALPLAKAIEEEGGQCLVLPSIQIIPVPISDEKAFLIQKQWENSDFLIFVSQYAVQYFQSLKMLVRSAFPPCGGRCPAGRMGGEKIAAIGKSTAKALERAGIPVDYTPSDSSNPSSEGLLDLPAFQPSSVKNKTITIFRGKSGRTFLDETLTQRGALVNEVVLYERIIPVWPQKERERLMTHTIDLALGLSIDSLTYFFSQLDLYEKKRFLDVPWLVMSHRVAEEAKKLGISTVYTVSKGDVLGSLIRSCSPGTIGGV